MNQIVDIVKRSGNLNRTGIRRQMAIAMAMALGLGLTVPTMAQASAAGQPATTASKVPAKSAKGMNVPAPSNAELQNFVGAAFAVQKIGQKVRPELKQAKNDKARLKLQKQAESKMKAAVRAHHLSVARYQQIYKSMQTDPAVKKQVEKLVQARRQAMKGKANK